jgi:RNA polymerase sigma-70 factor (ECF subfamily)
VDISTHISILMGFKDDEARSEAMRRFCARYQSPILNWCLRKGLQPADADDVTQTILIKVFEKLPEHEHDPERGSFRSWLGRVVSNAIIDHFRARQRHPADYGYGGKGITALTEEDSLFAVAGDLETDMQADAEEGMRRARTQVAQAHWDAFERSTVGGQSAQQVAKELGISVANVYRYRRRALVAIRAEVAKIQNGT